MTKKRNNQKIDEELGRNNFTPNTNPYQYYESAEVSVDMYPVEGKYAVKVDVPNDPSLSSDERQFATEQEAVHFARSYTEFVQRVLNQRTV
tara:strand:+ start:390 stop:662 length:273 start_codon:yes stop_codon:yes gene_type:complete